jgi:hypothetical protein
VSPRTAGSLTAGGSSVLARTLRDAVEARAQQRATGGVFGDGSVLQRRIFWIGGLRYDALDKAAAEALHAARPAAAPVVPPPVVAAPLPAPLTAVVGAATPAAFAGRRAAIGGAVHLGVGEQVPLTVNAPPADGTPVQWTLVSGDAEVTGVTTAGVGLLTAGPTPGPVRIALEVADGPHEHRRLSEHTFEVVAPTTAVTDRVPGSNLRHTAGTAGVGFQMFVSLRPADVPFARVEWREDFGLGLGYGVFSGENGRQHAPTGVGYDPVTNQPIMPPSIGGHAVAPTPQWMGVNPVDGAFTNWVRQTDTVDTGTYPPTAAGTWPKSSHAWDIDWTYRVKRSTDTSYSGAKPLMKARHEAEISTLGDATIKKAGSGPFTLPASAPTSTF